MTRGRIQRLDFNPTLVLRAAVQPRCDNERPLEVAAQRRKAVVAGFTLAALVLSACHRHAELTASEAIQAADAALVAELPQLKHHMSDVKAEADNSQNRWRVDYYGGIGGATVYVDMRTGRATVAEIQQ